MKLADLFPSRLTIAAVAGCAALLPLSIWLGWTAGVANRDRVTAEAEADRLDLLITAPQTGYIARLTSCQVSLAGAQASVAAQNAAIDNLQQAADAAGARAAAAVAAAQASARAAERRADAVLTAVPREGEGRCEAAFRLHQENAQ